jgi:hypothetical protein
MFYLGGYDLEMVTIREFLTSIGQGFLDMNLAWGAKASAYREFINTSADRNETPVLVELEVDIKLPVGTIVIDHHGDRFAEEASLIQVIKFFGRAITREDELIAANDSGYIPAMLAMGATQAEIDSIRLRDRQAQGVTEIMEMQAEHAIFTSFEDTHGTKVVYLANKKPSTVTDRLFTSWPDGKQNLLVICQVMNEVDEYHYYGRGDLCKAFKERFAPGSWGGSKGYGDPNGQGLAGCRTNDANAVDAFFESFWSSH